MKGDAAALVDALVDGCGVVDGDAAARRHAGLTATAAGGGEGGRGKREICGEAQRGSVASARDLIPRSDLPLFDLALLLPSFFASTSLPVSSLAFGFFFPSCSGPPSFFPVLVLYSSAS